LLVRQGNSWDRRARALQITDQGLRILGGIEAAKFMRLCAMPSLRQRTEPGTVRQARKVATDAIETRRRSDHE